MAKSSFSYQSAWLNGYSTSIPDVDFRRSTDPVIMNLDSLEFSPVYNFVTINNDDKPSITPTGVGFFLVNVSLSTKGATNDTIELGMSYDGSLSKMKLKWQQKGGNFWSTNYNTIIKITTTETEKPLQFLISSTIQSDVKLAITSFNLSIIKLY